MGRVALGIPREEVFDSLGGGLVLSESGGRNGEEDGGDGLAHDELCEWIIGYVM